jgi:hypothetical protein
MREPGRISKKTCAARSERNERLATTYGSLDDASACGARRKAFAGLFHAVGASSPVTTEHADITKNGNGAVDEPASGRSALGHAVARSSKTRALMINIGARRIRAEIGLIFRLKRPVRVLQRSPVSEAGDCSRRATIVAVPGLTAAHVQAHRRFSHRLHDS